MSLYNILFGQNAQTDLLLAVIGLKQNDVERFRDVHASQDGATIDIYTRTGGGNRSDYPNMAMRKRPEWAGSQDDDFDSTYCTDTFNVPEEWQADVVGLRNPLEHGLRKEFAQHLAKTLNREPTEGDKARAAYQAEEWELRKVPHVKANGHTFVPYSDRAMKTALKLAEANDGELLSCWGILPLTITVKTNHFPYPKAKSEDDRNCMVRVDIGYEWVLDEDYWKHCQQRWADEYPLTMAKIAKDVERNLERKRA